MAELRYVDWDGLVYYDGKIKSYISDIAEDFIKMGGVILFNELPDPSFQNLNYIYRITDDFTSTDRFEKPGYDYPAGTWVQCINHEEDERWLYTIFNEETIGGTDLSNYYTKSEVDEAIANVEHPTINLDDYATKDDIKGFIKEIPSEYITESELNEKGYLTQHQDISGKADLILFTTDNLVSNPVGKFEVGDNVKDLTIAEILAKLLGLQPPIPTPNPPDPDISIREDIITNKRPIFTINKNGEVIEVIEVPYEYIDFTESTAEFEPNGSGFYEVKNDNGETIECGYQHVTEPSDDMYYTVMLPSRIILGDSARLETWNAASSIWTEVDSSTLTNNYDVISDAFDEVGLKPPTVLEGYTLWVDLNGADAGAQYRFIVEEEA